MTAATRKILPLAIAGALALPAAGHAATLEVGNGGVYTYTGGDGKANTLQATFYSFMVGLYESSGDPITLTGPQAGACSVSDTPPYSSVSCSLAPTSVTVNLGGEADRAQVGVEAGVPATTNGEGGDDVLSGSGTVNGGAGDDRLESNNTQGIVLNGDDGDDTFKGGDNDDTFNGGTGSDTADYAAYNGHASYSLDGVKNDGPSGQDNVGVDVENVLAGSGNDTITGSDVANTLSGGGGNDAIDGRGGNDIFPAGRAFDGKDVIAGGAGSDTADYRERETPVRIMFDDKPNDGAGGEYDALGADVEHGIGGFADDYLAGHAGAVANMLYGGHGDDDLHGGAGNDLLYGQSGADTLDGGDGIDTVRGEEGNDSIDAGPGNDTALGGDGFDAIDGGAGRDTLSGENGADVLHARDGEIDTVNCGAGADTADRDALGDTANADCEVVSAPALPPSAMSFSPRVAAPAPGATSGSVAPDARRDARPAKARVVCALAGRRAAGRRLKCRVALPEGGSARGVTARLSRGGRVFAVGRAKARDGRSIRLTAVRKPRPGRYELVLRRAGRQVLSVTVSVR